jgi:hypothetical protein
VPPALSIARSGSNLVITYAGGVLQSAPDVTGAPWTDETAVPSGSAIQTTGAHKFYRVKQ